MKSTEERELEIIEAKKKELEVRRKLAQESYKATQSSTAYVPPQSKQPLTRPDAIHFATDERIKGTHDNKNDKEINFTKLLRHNRSRVSTCPCFASDMHAPDQSSEVKHRPCNCIGTQNRLRLNDDVIMS